MKKLLVVAALFVCIVAGAQQTETRNLASFSKLEVDGSFDVILDEGNAESAKIVAEGVDTKKIITEVKDNTLEVYMERGQYRNTRVKVYLTFKSLTEISKDGSGNLVCNAALSASDFILKVEGSGNTLLKRKIKAVQITIKKSGSGNVKAGALETEGVNLDISGSGNFEIAEGNVKKQFIHLSGSASVVAFGLKSNDCIASITGSGNIDISVSGSLEGTIAGSGSINYKGDATITKSAIMGSGRINRN